ncbi:MAG: hypothetical protein Q7T86_19490 [Hyphomicrobiaceae bacterium]|nr:hypothetical protein [Hyphomicrobiaceae bacterium]
MGANSDFWRDQTVWPRDTAEWVFLARATDLLGRRLFGDQWTREECFAELMRPIDATTDARTLNNIIAKHLPQFGRKEFHGSMASPPIVPIGQRDTAPGLPPPRFQFTGEEQRCAAEFVRAQNAKALEGIERFKAAQEALVDYAVGGEIVTSFRTNGEYKVIPSAWWNTEKLNYRFDRCKIDPDAPFEAKGQSWIFVSKAGLEGSRKSVVSGPGKGGGRPPEYNWEEARLYCLSVVAEHGRPGRGNRRLPTQADLISLVVEHFANKDIHPAPATVKAKVSKWLSGEA